MTHTLRDEIAKELFLEAITRRKEVLLPDSVARIAGGSIECANIFIAELKKEPSALKGCPKCFGSGGKIVAPCKHCGGSGKVAK